MNCHFHWTAKNVFCRLWTRLMVCCHFKYLFSSSTYYSLGWMSLVIDWYLLRALTVPRNKWPPASKQNWILYSDVTPTTSSEFQSGDSLRWEVIQAVPWKQVDFICIVEKPKVPMTSEKQREKRLPLYLCKLAFIFRLHRNLSVGACDVVFISTWSEILL